MMSALLILLVLLIAGLLSLAVIASLWIDN
jgi:hypothetical protein